MAGRSPYTAIKTIKMRPETLAYLDALAKQHRTTSSALIRDAVNYWLQARLRRRESGEEVPLIGLPEPQDSALFE